MSVITLPDDNSVRLSLRIYGVDSGGPAVDTWPRAQRQAPLHSPRFQPHTASYHVLLKITDVPLQEQLTLSDE